MNKLEKLNLQKMISANNVKDETENIREKKHSNTIKMNLDKFLEIKKEYENNELDEHDYENRLIDECYFLFTNYTDIFNKIKKDELDISLFNEFLEILKSIEDGKIDQHEGSYKVGKLLKEIYVDSALKKSSKLDKLYENDKKEVKKGRELSYKDFKNAL